MVTQDNISSIGNKNICHGLGCFNIATNSIEEDGCDVTLMLCDDCLKKFPKQETNETLTEAQEL